MAIDQNIAGGNESIQTIDGVEGSAALDISKSDILKSLVDGYGSKGGNEGKKRFQEILSKRLKQEATKFACFSEYNVLVIFDNTRIVKEDADRIYQSINSFDKITKKPLLMILLSRGGDPGSAYLLGKLCQEWCNGNFIVVIPRYAKSAATLLATAANEIHMGSLSELGPIDPQINKMPALGLKHTIEHIAQLVGRIPKSSEMFARYLSQSVNPIDVGYYERTAKSAAQYAERLLEAHKDTLVDSPKEIANKLVYEYKDHGFVIDKTEAEKIFGSKTIKTNTEEYQLGNSIYEELSNVGNIADMMNLNFFFVGSLDAAPVLKEIE